MKLNRIIKTICRVVKKEVSIVNGNTYRLYAIPRKLTIRKAKSVDADKYLLAYRINKRGNFDHYHWMKLYRDNVYPLLSCKDGYISTSHHPYENMYYFTLYNIVGEKIMQGAEG